MATRSFILCQNDDDTFSGRYHHWDGYPEGLGVFLQENINTRKKVDWLFDLKSPFSTLLSAPKTEPSDVEFPSWFGFKIPRRVSLLDAPEMIFDNLSWKECQKTANESYTYLYIDNTWNIVIRQRPSFQESKYISVEKYILLASLTKVLDDDEKKTIKNIHNAQKLNPSFVITQDMSSVDAAMKAWVETPQDILKAFKRDVLNFEYDFEEDQIQHIDNLCQSFVQKKMLSHELSEAKAKKSQILSPRKI